MSKSDDLQSDIAALTERVQRLEERHERPAPPGASGPDSGEDQFWALSELSARLDDHPETIDGAVMLVGTLTLPSGAHASWQQSAGTAGLLDTDWADHAAALAALGHPARLELLRNILRGTHSTADLAKVASSGTTGQLHHHLRQLVATGWVRQSGRGTYEVPATRVVPLLTSLVGAQR